MRFWLVFSLVLCLAPPLAAGVADQASPVASPPSGGAADNRTEAVLVPYEEIQMLRQCFHDVVYQRTIERLTARKKQLGASNAARVIDAKIQRLDTGNAEYIAQCSQDILRLAQKAQIDMRKILYFLYIDRNRNRQLALVGFFDPSTRTVSPVGLDLISSGDMDKGKDHYLTPEGVFENRVENFGYRALGTPNQDGWMGLGAKGSRVWDFGFQPGLRIYRGGPSLAQMRLLVHATDPVQGESRLGRRDSKGCVRISAGLNEFLDRWAILDGNYEQWVRLKGRTWLLRQDRTPVLEPGRYLFIGDSSESGQPPVPGSTGMNAAKQGAERAANALN